MKAAWLFAIGAAAAAAACGDEAPRWTRYDAPLASPRDVVVAQGGAIYVSEFGAGRVVRVDEAGAVSIAGGLTSPIGLRELPDGDLIVAEEGAGSVARLDVASGARTPIAEGLGNVTYLALGPDGAAYVSAFTALDAVGDGVVWRVDVATGAATRFATGLTVPEGLMFDGDRLIVAEWALPSPIVRFPAGGGARAGAAVLGEGFAHVYGVADDRAGGVLVGDHEGRVAAVRADGRVDTIVDGIGRPGGFAWDGDALLVVEFVDFGATGALIRVP